MKRARDIIGLPVISSATGKQIGTAKDLLLGRDWKVMGILLDTRHWFTQETCILVEDVQSFGNDAVMIGEEKAVQSAQTLVEGSTVMDGPRKLRGRPILTANGMQLGMIEDVILEAEQNRHVVALELTEGFISDLRDGLKRLPLPDSALIGEDAIIVPAGFGEV